MIFILLFILILILGIFLSLNNDILRPSIGMIFFFIISISAAILNTNIWHYEMSFKCFICIFMSIIIYGFIDFIVNVILKRKRKTTKLDVIKISKFKFILLVLVMLISNYIYYKDISYIGAKYGVAGNWHDMINFYRNTSMLGQLDTNVSSLASNLFLFSTSLAYVFMYLFVQNLAVDLKYKNNYLNIIPLLIFCINSILTGGRMPIIRLVVAGVFGYLFFYSNMKREKSFSIKIYFRLIIFGLIGLLGFFSISNLVGRNYNGSILYYITSYLGGSIPLFDLFLKKPVAHSIFGYETFPSVLSFLKRNFNILPNTIILVNKEFRSLNGLQIGNVYTAFRAYISDFGYIGMFLLTAIHSLFYSMFYKHLKINNTKKISINVLIYMYMIHAVYLMSIDDRLYSDLVSINTLKVIIFFYVIVKFLTSFNILNKKIKFKLF